VLAIAWLVVGPIEPGEHRDDSRKPISNGAPAVNAKRSPTVVPTMTVKANF